MLEIYFCVTVFFFSFFDVLILKSYLVSHKLKLQRLRVRDPVNQILRDINIAGINHSNFQCTPLPRTML